MITINSIVDAINKAYSFANYLTPDATKVEAAAAAAFKSYKNTTIPETLEQLTNLLASPVSENFSHLRVVVDDVVNKLVQNLAHIEFRNLLIDYATDHKDLTMQIVQSLDQSKHSMAATNLIACTTKLNEVLLMLKSLESSTRNASDVLLAIKGDASDYELGVKALALSPEKELQQLAHLISSKSYKEANAKVSSLLPLYQAEISVKPTTANTAILSVLKVIARTLSGFDFLSQIEYVNVTKFDTLSSNIPARSLDSSIPYFAPKPYSQMEVAKKFSGMLSSEIPEDEKSELLKLKSDSVDLDAALFESFDESAVLSLFCFPDPEAIKRFTEPAQVSDLLVESDTPDLESIEVTDDESMRDLFVSSTSDTSISAKDDKLLKSLSNRKTLAAVQTRLAAIKPYEETADKSESTKKL